LKNEVVERLRYDLIQETQPRQQAGASMAR
jgi:hypothetical protein